MCLLCWDLLLGLLRFELDVTFSLFSVSFGAFRLFVAVLDGEGDFLVLVLGDSFLTLRIAFSVF